jgi:hypothetical protein
VVVIVLAISGGGEDPAAPDKGPGEDSKPRDGAGAGGAAGKPRKKPQALPAVVQPKTLELTAEVAGRSRPQAVVVENRGDARITIGDVRLEGKDKPDFVTTDGCSGSPLSRGDICKIVVSFTPAKRGITATRAAVLVFTNDGKGGRQTVALRGTVGRP